jgi:hypothetical protein
MNEKEFIYWLAGVMEANAGNNFITEKLVEVIRKKLAKFVEQQEPSPVNATVHTVEGPKNWPYYPKDSKW